MTRRNRVELAYATKRQEALKVIRAAFPGETEYGMESGATIYNLSYDRTHSETRTVTIEA